MKIRTNSEALDALAALTNYLESETEAAEPFVFETATELREVILNRLPAGYSLHVNYRPQIGQDSFWEAKVVKTLMGEITNVEIAIEGLTEEGTLAKVLDIMNMGRLPSLEVSL